MRTWAVLIALVAVGCGGGNAAAPTVTAPEPPASTAAVTWRAAEGLLFYARVQQGFRAGGLFFATNSESSPPWKKIMP